MCVRSFSVEIRYGTEHTLTFEHQEKVASWGKREQKRKKKKQPSRQDGAMCDCSF